MFEKKNTTQQGPLTADQKRIIRKRKARLRAIGRVLIVVALVAAVILVWQNWSALAPNNLMSSVESLLGIGTGEYPVDLSGVAARRLVRAQGYSVLLTDSHLVYLNSSGAEVNRYPCAYPTALVDTAGSYVLVAEQEGRRFHLSNRSKVLLEGEAKRDIIAVSLNEKGQFAVLTKGPQGYLVEVTVYDRHGKETYTRSRNHTALDVALSDDGGQLGLLSVAVEGDTMTTVMESFSTKSTDATPLCKYEKEDSLLMCVEYLKNDWLVSIDREGAVMMDTGDGLATIYAPTGMQVLGYSVSEDMLALVVQPYGSTGGGQVHLINQKGEAVSVTDFTGNYRHLSGNGGQFVLLTDHYVQKITADGAGNPVTVEADGQQVILDGDNAIVLETNRLDGVPLS